MVTMVELKDALEVVAESKGVNRPSLKRELPN